MTEPTPKSLKELLSAWATTVSGSQFPGPPNYTGPDVMLTSIVEHTSEVRPGSCFVARVRTGSDGHLYIGQAIREGASLILGERDPTELAIDFGKSVYLQVNDSAVAEAWLAAAWYEFPSQDLVITGITGTDGKTTTVNILFNILREAGLPAGMLSTLKALAGGDDESLALHVTTPEAPVIQRYLRRMVDAGLSHCVLEVTSHGLAQERVGAIIFDVAIVTNITHEHLDYHGSYEQYLSAKAKLFHRLAPVDQDQSSLAGLASSSKSPLEWDSLPARIRPTAILNRDDSSYSSLATIPVSRRLSYGVNQAGGVSGADVSGEDLDFSSEATRFTLRLPGHEPLRIASSMVGPFNVYNMVAAATGAYALGIDPLVIRRGLEGVQQLYGRMQPVSRGQNFQVVVDFAHTPNALSQAIGAGRRMTSGRLITVFGSAGKRDVEKRRLMAEISGREADLTILTAEDPRTESLDTILEMMAAGCRSQGGREGYNFWRVPDRGEAIFFALTKARPGDLVLICGKGHEQSMCFGTVEYPWDDVQAATTALEALLAGKEMPDLGLPTFDQTSNK